MDIIGKRFGRLVVERMADRKDYVVCKCDCGNTVEVKMYYLTTNHGPTRSCGCLHREAIQKIGRQTIRRNSAVRLAEMAQYQTNLYAIANKEPYRNNKSGHKGVWYNPSTGKYHAYITFHKRRRHLGVYHNYDDAVKARELAEEQLFSPVVEEWEASREENHVGKT